MIKEGGVIKGQKTPNEYIDSVDLSGMFLGDICAVLIALPSFCCTGWWSGL